MQRLLSHLLLLLYAGVYLHCQPLPVGAGSVAADGSAQQETPRNATCKKKPQTVQADTKVEKELAQAKLLPLDAALNSDLAALYFGLLFPAHQPTLNPTRGPTAGPAQVFANHPNKAPPVRFS